MKKQKALIVSVSENDEEITELNRLLGAGWMVHSSCPMSNSHGGNGFIEPTCLVILEKEV